MKEAKEKKRFEFSILPGSDSYLAKGVVLVLLIVIAWLMIGIFLDIIGLFMQRWSYFGIPLFLIFLYVCYKISVGAVDFAEGIGKEIGKRIRGE